MFKLIMFRNGDCGILRGKHSVRGPRKEILNHLVREGVDPAELAEACTEMLVREHNVADFGIYKKFIFSEFVAGIDDEERGVA